MGLFNVQTGAIMSRGRSLTGGVFCCATLLLEGRDLKIAFISMLMSDDCWVLVATGVGFASEPNKASS